MAPRLRSGGPPAPDDARPPGPERGPDLAQHPTEPGQRAPHGSILLDPATTPFSSTAEAELSNQGEHSDGSASAQEMGGSSADEAASAGRTPTARPRRALVARRDNPMASPSPSGPKPASPCCSVTRGAQGQRAPAAEYAAGTQAAGFNAHAAAAAPTPPPYVPPPQFPPQFTAQADVHEQARLQEQLACAQRRAAKAETGWLQAIKATNEAVRQRQDAKAKLAALTEEQAEQHAEYKQHVGQLAEQVQMMQEQMQQREEQAHVREAQMQAQVQELLQAQQQVRPFPSSPSSPVFPPSSGFANKPANSAFASTVPRPAAWGTQHERGHAVHGRGTGAQRFGNASNGTFPSNSRPEKHMTEMTVPTKVNVAGVSTSDGESSSASSGGRRRRRRRRGRRGRGKARGNVTATDTSSSPQQSGSGTDADTESDTGQPTGHVCSGGVYAADGAMFPALQDTHAARTTHAAHERRRSPHRRPMPRSLGSFIVPGFRSR